MKDRQTKKLIYCSTVPMSLNIFCKGLLREMMEEYEVIAISSPDTELNEIAEREGVKTIGVDIRREISPLADLRSLYLLWKTFRQERPDIVHSFTPKAGLLCMMAARMTGVPVRIHTFTGLIWPTSTGLKRAILKTTDRITCFCASHIIPEGEGVRQDLINGRITRKDMHVLGYGNVRGVDLTYYCPTHESITRRKSVASEQLHFLFVGRIVKDKGINELISAFVQVQARYPNTRLTLVGWEEDSDPISPAAKEVIRTCSNIMVTGRQEDVRPYYEESDCLVFPSYREGFPNVVLEAGAMGLPSIVTDINGSREIIQTGLNGIIVPSKDVNALAEAMLQMIKQPRLRVEMGNAATKRISERYDQRFVRSCLKDYYHRIG